MTEKTIRRLKIENFKSIDSLEVKGLAPFSVFAGANGSGKSNFFDALDFVGLFVRGGIEIALGGHGAWQISIRLSARAQIPKRLALKSNAIFCNSRKKRRRRFTIH